MIIIIIKIIYLFKFQTEDDSDSCGAKRLNKAMSPGSMTLPTMNNWDMNQAMSPYIPPDMNSKFLFGLLNIKTLKN